MRDALKVAVLGVLIATATAGAQETRREPTRRVTAPAPAPARASRPRQATAAEPPAPAPVYAPAPLYAAPTVYVSDGYLLTGAPYLALADGSVLVNFGSGYERVLRPCAAPVQVVPSDPWGRDALGRIPDPPGIAAIKAGSRGQTSGATPSRSAATCYRVDAQGRPEMVPAGR